MDSVYFRLQCYNFLQMQKSMGCWREDLILTESVQVVAILFASSKIADNLFNSSYKVPRTLFLQLLLVNSSVLERGLEPPWSCLHYDLNVARLPISPLQQRCCVEYLSIHLLFPQHDIWSSAVRIRPKFEFRPQGSFN